jgi:phage terminase large subunit-like protein
MIRQTISSRARTETRGERVCRFIEAHLKVPEGDLYNQPVRLAAFQRRFILEIYDNPQGTSRAYLSIARKNGKTALIAAILLAHICGPEAVPNSQIVSGAQSRDQAAQVWNYAAKMARLSGLVPKYVREVPSSKKLVGVAKNVEYRALSADAKTNHGLSPVLAILDELGQVRGPADDFVEAIVTSQGAYDGALLLAISTQAASDGDLFSRWLDDARDSGDPHIVCHLYTAPDECELDDRNAWRAANPAMGLFRSEIQLERDAETAKRQRHEENSFRWLYLNQRISAEAPFVSKGEWAANSAEPRPFGDAPVYGGLDLSQRADMTALVFVADHGDEVSVEPHFWLPDANLGERSRRERVPYDIWAESGHLHVSPGQSVDFREVAAQIMRAREEYNLVSIAYDAHMAQALWPILEDMGLTVEEREALFEKVPQTYAGMSPGIDALMALLRDGKVRHGAHQVLSWHARNAVLIRGRVSDQYMLAKPRGADNQRIDGIVAMAMAAGRRETMMIDAGPGPTPWDIDLTYRMTA